MEGIKPIRKLGKGSMGEVYLVESNGHYYAVKKIPKAITTREQIKESFKKYLYELVKAI